MPSTAGATLAVQPETETENVLNEANEAAVKAGVFGVPSFTIDKEIFFGGDRLDFVKEYALEVLPQRQIPS